MKYFRQCAEPGTFKLIVLERLHFKQTLRH